VAFVPVHPQLHDPPMILYLLLLFLFTTKREKRKGEKSHVETALVDRSGPQTERKRRDDGPWKMNVMRKGNP